VNPRLRFDRAAAYGRHAAIPAGSSIRFDPGETHGVLKRTRLLKQGDNALSFYGSDLILTNPGNKDIHPEYKSELPRSLRLPSSPSPRVS